MRETVKPEEPPHGFRHALDSVAEDILEAVFVAMLLMWIVSVVIAPMSKILPAKTLSRHPCLSYLEYGSDPAVFALSTRRHDDTGDEGLRNRIAKSRLTMGKWTREENTPLSLRPFPIRSRTNGVSRRCPAHFASHAMTLVEIVTRRSGYSVVGS